MVDSTDCLFGNGTIVFFERNIKMSIKTSYFEDMPMDVMWTRCQTRGLINLQDLSSSGTDMTSISLKLLAGNLTSGKVLPVLNYANNVFNSVVNEVEGLT